MYLNLDLAQFMCHIVYALSKHWRISKMANITLKIDDQILEKARRLASRRETSINAIVRKKLEEFVASDLSRETTLKGLEDFYSRSRARIGKRTWTREELHER